MERIPPRDTEDMKLLNPADHRGKFEKFTVNSEGGVTTREARKLYKQALAKSAEIEENERRKREERTQRTKEQQKIFDCLRCMLIQQGNIMISDCTIRTCKFQVPNGHTEVSETELTQSESLPQSGLADYAQTLAITTALGNTEPTPSIAPNLPPQRLIKERRIHASRTVIMEDGAHRCVPSTKPRTVAATVTLKVATKVEARTANHSVVYAPPSFGKTTLQEKLASQGRYILDTDDIPFLTEERLRSLLTWTSVLTNRLDVLKPDMPTIAFVPESSQALKHGVRELMDLSDEDAAYWHKCHDKFQTFEQITICRAKSTHISSWFYVESPDQGGSATNDSELTVDTLVSQAKLRLMRSEEEAILGQR